MEEWNGIWKTNLVWNGKFLVWNGCGMEEILQNGIWKNRIPFHSIACPAYRQERIQGGGMWGMHLPPPAIFKHVFNEFNFSIISNLFDNNKSYALSTHNRKCVRTKCIILGATLRIRGKKFKQNLPKICSKSTKMVTTVCKFSKIIRGSMSPDRLEPFLFSICFKIIRRKTAL